MLDLDPATGAARPYLAGNNPDTDVRGVLEDDAGTIWVGSYRGGLVKIDPISGRLTRYQHDPANPKSLNLNAIQTLIKNGREGLWVALENGGLDRFDFATGDVHAQHPTIRTIRRG